MARLRESGLTSRLRYFASGFHRFFTNSRQASTALGFAAIRTGIADIELPLLVPDTAFLRILPDILGLEAPRIDNGSDDPVLAESRMECCVQRFERSVSVG